MCFCGNDGLSVLGRDVDSKDASVPIPDPAECAREVQPSLTTICFVDVNDCQSRLVYLDIAPEVWCLVL